MTHFRRARWGVRRTFQTEQAIEELSVYENVAMVHEHSRAPGATRRQDVLGAIEFVGLRDPYARVGTLGAGDRRLVEVARAVVGKPRLVLLDEPAAGLPDEETEHLSGVIKAIPEHSGALTMLVDHDMSLVSACCDDDRGARLRAAAGIRADRRDPPRRARDQGLPGNRGGRVSAAGEDRLEVSGVTVARGGRAVVRDVSIEIPAGEVTALLGPNGAGKSSLVLAIGGVLRPTAGSVTLDGRQLAGRRPERIRRAGVAIVPEGRRLLPELTVEENIRVATYSLSRNEAAAGRARALELFPELEKRLSAPGQHALRRRAADGRARPGARLPAPLRGHRRAVARPRAGHHQAADPDDPRGRRERRRRAADRAVRDRRARARQPGLRSWRAGAIQYAGTAAELREKPELLHTAYLLRGSEVGETAAASFALGSARDRSVTAAVMITSLEHVLVLSDDIDATRDFYRDVVGLAVGARPAARVPRLLAVRRAGAVPAHRRADGVPRARRLARAAGRRCRLHRGPVDHIAFGATDYDTVLAQLRAARRPGGAEHGPGGVLRQLFIDDPNGVRVEINVPITPRLNAR